MAHSPNADDEKQAEAYRILERDAAGARAAEPVTYEGHPNVLLGSVPTAAQFQPTAHLRWKAGVLQQRWIAESYRQWRDVEDVGPTCAR